AWVTALVKPTIAPNDLEREIVQQAGAAVPMPINGQRLGSSAAIEASPPPSPVADADIPDLDLPGMPKLGAAAPPKAPPPNPDMPTVTPPAHVRTADARSPSSAAMPKVTAPTKGIALDPSDG